MQQKVTAVYFSPTGGTKTYVCAVAAAMAEEYAQVDLTRLEVRAEKHAFSSDEVVVLGVPVYYGRVPEVPGLLDSLQGDSTPVVLLAVYGNRLIDDTLVELEDLCRARGFVPAAGGAFVAPHTFSARIGMGRPNEADLASAAELGRQTAEKLEKGEWNSPCFPGNRPYRTFQRVPFYPTGGENCVACGACAWVCPVQAIPAEEPQKTDSDKCIRCLACVRVCPAKSRRVRGPVFPVAVLQLEEKLTGEDKQPELYL